MISHTVAVNQLYKAIQVCLNSSTTTEFNIQCIHVCVYLYTYTNMYTRTYMCMYVYTHPYIHVARVEKNALIWWQRQSLSSSFFQTISAGWGWGIKIYIHSISRAFFSLFLICPVGLKWKNVEPSKYAFWWSCWREGWIFIFFEVVPCEINSCAALCHAPCEVCNFVALTDRLQQSVMSVVP